MTPEQIEVGYYATPIGQVYVQDISFVQSERFVGHRIIGRAVDDDSISEPSFFFDVSKWVPSTREAFNAAVDRVAKAVKGE